MELIGGLAIIGVFGLAAFLGWVARRNPSQNYTTPDTSGISERDWQNAIK